MQKISQKAKQFGLSQEEQNELRFDLEILAKKRKSGKTLTKLLDKTMPFNVKITDSPTIQKVIKEEKLEIAEAMLADGLPHEQIVKYTGLSLKQIRQLAKEIENKKKG